MNRPFLEHFAYVCDNTRESVLECLSELSVRDNDFNGINGDEYLWEEAKGYESNMDYCLAQIDGCTPHSMVEKFIFTWFGNDSFYLKYKLSVIECNDKLFVSLAYLLAH